MATPQQTLEELLAEVRELRKAKLVDRPTHTIADGIWRFLFTAIVVGVLVVVGVMIAMALHARASM